MCWPSLRSRMFPQILTSMSTFATLFIIVNMRRTPQNLLPTPPPTPSSSTTPPVAPTVTAGTPMEIDATKTSCPHAPLSKEEHECHHCEGLCSYCGGKHVIDSCPNMSEHAKKALATCKALPALEKAWPTAHLSWGNWLMMGHILHLNVCHCPPMCIWWMDYGLHFLNLPLNFFLLHLVHLFFLHLISLFLFVLLSLITS